MITSRGWRFLIMTLGLLALGVLGRLPICLFDGLTPHLLLISLTLLVWLAVERVLFTLRGRVLLRGIVLVREIRDERGAVDTIWQGRIFTVRLDVLWNGSLGPPHVAITDWLPIGVERVSGPARYEGPIRSGEPVNLSYQIRADHLGRVRFEGVRIELADLQGFFKYTTFVRVPMEFRVLPVLVNESGRPTSASRFSLLPPPGQHRLRKPGSGSELLDLRDYVPGDPPRTIAWKVSARRDRLITKEFETEVPIRCTLFVDTANSVRLGPCGRNALAVLVDVAASVAQANSGAKDLTGLCLFDDRSATVVRPARASGHLARLLKMLVDVAGLAPCTSKTPVESLLPLAHSVASELYPDLLAPHVNHVPFWLAWCWPSPLFPKRWRLSTNLGRLVFMAVAFLPFIAIALLAGLFIGLIDYWVNDTLSDQGSDITISFDAFYLLLFLATGVWAILYAWFLYRIYQAQPLLFSATNRRLVRWRKQMAALLSLREGLAPGGLSALMEDDGRLALAIQRFLAEHHIPYVPPLYDHQGRYLFASAEKLDVLSKELVRSVARGRDNELYVLLVDLLELDDRVDPLLRAVKVALGRHHQVIVICPWPAGLGAEPAIADRGMRLADSTGKVGLATVTANPQSAIRNPQFATATTMLEDITVTRLHGAYRRVRRAFARLGVPVLDARRDDPVALVLERMYRLRTLRRKV